MRLHFEMTNVQNLEDVETFAGCPPQSVGVASLDFSESQQLRDVGTVVTIVLHLRYSICRNASAQYPSSATGGSDYPLSALQATESGGEVGGSR